MRGLCSCEDHGTIVAAHAVVAHGAGLLEGRTAAGRIAGVAGFQLDGGFQLDLRRRTGLCSIFGSTTGSSCLPGRGRGVRAATTTPPCGSRVPVETFLCVGCQGSGAALALAALDVGARQHRDHMALRRRCVHAIKLAPHNTAQDPQLLAIQLLQVALTLDQR
jgi:hypothetical protein